MTDTPQYGKIFKKHPLPVRTSNPGKKYDFSQMEVGDAILLPASSAGSITWLRQRYGWKMVRRAVDDNSIMLWRLK